MSLLTIAQDVADETKGARPATIAGNSDTAAQQFLRLINKVGTRLMRIYAWNALRKERAFTSIAGEEQTGAIPADFDHFVAETFWNRSTDRLLNGPISPVEWNGLKVREPSGGRTYFIYRGGSVFTSPALGAGASMAFEYVSKNWVDVAAGGSPKSSMTIDTDVALLDEELIKAFVKYEWLKDEGQPSYMEAGRDAREALDLLTRNDSPSAGIANVADIFGRGSRHFTGVPTDSSVYYDGVI